MGERHRVFAFSLADVFEDWSGKIVGSNGHAVYKGSLGGWMRSTGSPPSKSSLLRMDDARARLFGLIAATPRLDWLVLTKRPEAMSRFFKAKSNAWEAADYYRDYIYGRDSDVSLGDGLKDWPPRNLWAVTSVENQAAKSRIDELRNVESTVRFLSVEPLVEDLGELDLRGIDWVIVGGESGSKARPFDLAWARSIRDQCRRVGVAFFMKQIGSYPVVNYYDVILRDHYDRSGWDWPDPIDWSIEFDGQPRPTARVRLKTKDSHGGDWLEWGDEFLKVREFPGSKVR